MNDPESWPLRAVILAVAGAAIALAIDALLPADTRGPQAAAVGLAGLGIVFALVWSRRQLWPALGFAMAGGLVAAGGAWFAGGFSGNNPDLLRLASALLAVAVATPLFQAWREAAAPGRLPAYALAHDRAWTALVTLASALAFMVVSWLLAWLLAGLFRLIGITLLARLLEQHEVTALLIGGALGGGLGLARDQARILSTLQRVLRFVLSALAPVLALGLGLFLLALPVTGLAPLWQATKATTPILLASIAGALVLANAIIADTPAEESRRPVLRGAAAALLAAMLPLAIIAAVSTSLRISQYGLTPDRLWGATLVAVAAAYGAAPLWAALRPAAWMARVRAANLALAFGLCALALGLATPLADFGRLSTQSQLARLETGLVTPAEFDWAALRHDFGPSGMAALRRLASGKGETARLAAAALKSVDRWDMADLGKEGLRERQVAANLVVLPTRRPAPAAIIADLAANDFCHADTACVLHWPAEATTATMFVNLYGWEGQALLFRLGKAGWVREPAGRPLSRGSVNDLKNALRAGRAEVRMEQRPVLYVDGQPVRAGQ